MDDITKKETIITEEPLASKDNINELCMDELLKKVESAAEKGAKRGSRKGHFIPLITTLAIIAILAAIILPKYNNVSKKFGSLFASDEKVEGHDQTITNFGIFGYKTSDLEDVILGDSEKLKKLEVYKQNLSEIITLTDTGLFNWSALTKTKLVTFNGTAVYTVDLGKLSSSSISIDEDNFVVKLKIPHAVQEELNIPETDMTFGDTETGILAFGEIKFTPEQIAEIQANARKKMEEELARDKVSETADKFAKMAIWELYSPLIKKVSKGFTLEVEFE